MPLLPPAQWCVMAGVLLTPHCHGTYDPKPVRPVLTARDSGRCQRDPRRIKAPRPVHREDHR